MKTADEAKGFGKPSECARCGEPITVPDDFDPYEDMAVCDECDDELSFYGVKDSGETSYGVGRG